MPGRTDRDAQPLDLAERHPGNGHRYAISAEQAKVLLAAIREGAFPMTACRIADIRYGTFADWMEKGDDTKPDAEPREPYASFFRAVREAEAYAELGAQRKLNAGMESDWRAAAWLLSRRHGDRWAEKPQGVQVQAAGQVQFFLPDNRRDVSLDISVESDPSATT